MKNSGVRWIGDIPNGWDISKMQYIADYYNGFAFKPSDWSETGLQIIRIQDLTGSNDNPNYYEGQLPDRYKVRKGDILISWAATLNSFIWDREEAWLNQHIFKTKHHEEIVTREFFYWLTQVVMLNMNNANKHGIMMQHVTTNVFNKFSLPLPPLQEQKAIADFLDTKCAEIDGLLADLDAEVKTLTEYKKSIIAETVTHGLNANAKMKQLALGWIDEVPAHWRVDKFRYKLKPKKIVGQSDKEVLSVYREYGVIIKSSRDDNHNRTSDDTSTYKYVQPNDFVINKMKAWQGSMGVSDYEGIVSPAYFVYTFSDGDYIPRFFHYFMRNANNIPEYRRLSGGIREGQWDLSPYDLGNMPIIVPPKDEQKKIVAFLDDKCSSIDRAIADKQQQIDTLKAYKSSLIYEYVTGKKQVI